MQFLIVLLLAAPAEVNLPLKHLKLKKVAVEGSRSLRDVFPYVKGLTPKTLKDFVEPISSGEAALEAARLFAAGPLVKTKEAADRILAAAKKLQKELELLKPKILAHRPKSYAPSATAIDAKSWRVSFVAFEMHGILRLVHFEAKVSRDGGVELKRNTIVSGPMTSWQTDSLGVSGEDMREARMRADAVLGRERYARALKPARDLDTAWALARTLDNPGQLRDCWGAPDENLGSGLRIAAYDLADGTRILFDVTAGADRAFGYAQHVSRSPRKRLHLLKAR